ncbi:hypothetical protein SAMN06265365_117108 [Tistlia consotensis]|uniref:Uncharacterized protein n=1 Tax=Tistlia consotensis USBA 355 TaxID=560819 RepID=A0A1Y6CEJ8_9PROT|nr:hypothetical protein [Tistlia consotensis]SMF51241.1 hypothetical protein SAMN05428998_11811 [Tistlia consotensis USBA 355]SNR84613.1 hypothetical protein SAMN06265365_117108 [Tistlia consotensis]
MGDPMSSDLDIFRSAALLIRDHGEVAAAVAARRADALLDTGDLEGCHLWNRIVEAIDDLTRTQRHAHELTH